MAALRLGDQAPGFSLPVWMERRTASRTTRRPVAVVFSCCHCPYVVAWEDRLNETARDFDGSAGMLVINANAGYLGDSPDDMRIRAAEKGFSFPFLYDETQETSAYGAARTPEVFVFDAGHRLVYHGAPTRPPGSGRRGPVPAPGPGGRRPGTAPEVQETPPVGCTIKWR